MTLGLFSGIFGCQTMKTLERLKELEGRSSKDRTHLSNPQVEDVCQIRRKVEKDVLIDKVESLALKYRSSFRKFQKDVKNNELPQGSLPLSKKKVTQELFAEDGPYPIEDKKDRQKLAQLLSEYRQLSAYCDQKAKNNQVGEKEPTVLAVSLKHNRKEDESYRKIADTDEVNVVKGGKSKGENTK